MAVEPAAASPMPQSTVEIAVAGRSALASELRQLPARLRATLELRDWVIDTVDVLVSSLIALADPADSRTIEERFGWLLVENDDEHSEHDAEEFDRELAEWTQRLNAISETELPRWTKRLAGDGSWKRFARKLLGARSYDRLARAIEDDLSAMAEGFRRLVQIAQPFAVAFDDVIGVLTPEQIKGVDSTYDWAAISALRFLIQLDGAIGRYIESSFDWSSVQLVRPGEHSDVAEMAQRLRGAAVGPTRERLAELNARLASKISGAQDALKLSADGVSQAAHSLVELIDRILRSAFPDATVLLWLELSGRADDGLTFYTKDGRLRPTKRAQALCFAYGGRLAAEKSAVHEIVASGLVSARTQLQELKHADEGDEAEVQHVTSLMAAVDGFLTLTLRIGWATLGTEEVDGLRRRLAG